jgi:hypothetical protein
LPIQHHDYEEYPRAGTTYRCHICRLELVFDSKTERLVVQPMRPDEPDQRIRRTG